MVYYTMKKLTTKAEAPSSKKSHEFEGAKTAYTKKTAISTKPKPVFKTVSGNESAAYVAYQLSEAAAIYPITPSSDMAELCDAWAARGNKNALGIVPRVVQMQSEAGAAGTLHGLLAAGAMATTFTASQGLLLMPPNMFKIAGELLPCVIHVSARTVATHALSIFGDHSDIYSVRSTGFAMLASNSIQEAQDMALVAHLATIESSYPFLHFFDGFRTSHEFNKIRAIAPAEMRALLNTEKVAEFRRRALNPANPHQSGTAQNPDTFFQNREACNKHIDAVPEIVQSYMDRVSALVGKNYKLFEYIGDPNAEHIIIAMGSACETIEETLEKSAAGCPGGTEGPRLVCGTRKSKEGDKLSVGQTVLDLASVPSVPPGHPATGLLKVRLYRPFSPKHLIDAIPKSCRVITVLDRTKENGAVGDPLYLDVCSALFENGIGNIRVLAGRYGLSSKEFTPDMAATVIQNGEKALSMRDIPSKNKRFTIGINDDITHTSLDVIHFPSLVEDGGYKFYGLGSDGTVSANKNTVGIIGDNTDMYSQGYFVFDSKKSGSTTISHLRFSKNPIKSTYLVKYPGFVACHNQSFLNRFDMLEGIKQGGIFLLNTTHTPTELDAALPSSMKKILHDRKINFYIINAYQIAKDLGLKFRINTIMQSAFFRLTDIIPYTEAKALMKEAARKSYGKKGEAILNMNFGAIDSVETNLVKIDIPKSWSASETKAADTEKHKCGTCPKRIGGCSEKKYYNAFCAPINALKGDDLPVSAFAPDGRVPTGTSQFEKRNIATTLPKWIPSNCIQCNQCVFVCPHATIRAHLLNDGQRENAPDGFATLAATGLGPELVQKLGGNPHFRLQLNPADCTGCGVCAEVCPAREKALVMVNLSDVNEAENYAYSQTLPYPEVQNPALSEHTPPGQTSTDKPLSIAPTNVKNSGFLRPYFEFSGACAGCGQTPYIKLVTQLFGSRMIIANATGCSSIYGGSSPVCPYTKDSEGRGPAWANSLFEDNAEFGFGLRLAYDIHKDRPGVTPGLQSLRSVNPTISPKDPSIWIIGGDGWAYDIGYGGLDHVIANNLDVNILVLDTEVYSNTGGQQSKSTPAGAIAKFAAGGKQANKKDLGLIAMNYDNVYVAQIAIGANYQQTLTAIREAEAHPGPSLIIAYATCINHGIDMAQSMRVMKNAVDAGYWTLYRRNPAKGLSIDSREPTADFETFIKSETRYSALAKNNPEAAAALFAEAKQYAARQREKLKKLV